MVININIKIEDNNGHILQHYEERFDSDTSRREKYYYNTVLGKNLEDFLSAYLSVSGHIIREKLIRRHHTTSIDDKQPSPSASENTLHGEIIDQSEDNEMELSIRIGNRTVFTGKIELELPSRSNSADVSDSAAEIDEAQDNSTDHPDHVDHADASQQEEAEEISEFGLEHEDTEIRSIINYALSKAIEKYEANLCPSYREEEIEYKETELETASSSV